MKVLTWNLWNSFKRIENPFLVSYLEPKRRREQRYREQVNHIQAADFDICFLQEVNPVFSKIRDFKEILGLQVTYQVDQGGVRYRRVGLPFNFQNALVSLSKTEQNKLKGLKLSGRFGANREESSLQLSEFRYALFSETRIKNKKVLLVNTHFHHGIEWSETLRKSLEKIAPEDLALIQASMNVSDARKKQEADRLLAETRQRMKSYDAVIVAGDFNFSEGAEGLEGFKALGMKRVEHQGYTWDPERNDINAEYSNHLPPPVSPLIKSSAMEVLRSHNLRSRNIDHIFVSDNISVRDAKVFATLKNSEGFYPSDHFGIEAELQL